jgi:hypothetical protein
MWDCIRSVVDRAMGRLAPPRTERAARVARDDVGAQRRRRWALVLATWGIDVGPRRIHGVRVGALAVAR